MKRIGKKSTKKLIVLTIMLAILVFSAIKERRGWVSSSKETMRQMSQSTTAGTYQVTRFDDGDTIVVDMDGHQETVRFIGVDTPEVKDPRKPVQCFGKMASQFTKNLIGNNPVRLEADPTNTNRDRYNRLLRYIYLPDNTLVNAEIIKQGYGFAYTSFPFTKKEEFKNYERQAREENRGLWGSCQTGKDERGYNTINDDPSP